MLDKIWRFLKQLIQRLLGTTLPIFTGNQPTPLQLQPRLTLTDAEFEAKFMELLEGVNGGWGRGEVAGFLLAKQIKDGELVAWLRRFGARLLEGGYGGTAPTNAVVSPQELARRLELLSRIVGGELPEAAGNVGREILVEFPLPLLGEDEGEEDVDREAKEWYDRGKEQYIKGDFEGAIASFDKALEIKPDYHEAWLYRGNALRNLVRLEEAIASYLYQKSETAIKYNQN
jgi:tetratricopeptide (TPR) repeat protein